MSRPTAGISEALLQSPKYRGLSDRLKSLVFQVGTEKRGRFELAFYHHDIRAELIRSARRYGVDNRPKEYRHPMARGNEPDNVTSYLDSQANWGNDRAHYPEIIFTWQRPNVPYPDYELRNLRYRTILVVDWKLRPISDFQVMPLTLSNKFEGSKIEAIKRLDARIDLGEFVKRMPYKVNPEATSLEDWYIPYYKNNGSISNRAQHFRQKAGCCTWKGRANDKEHVSIRDFMDKRRGPWQKEHNTIRGLSDLDKKERLCIKALNFGTRSDRGRKNATKVSKEKHVNRFKAELAGEGLEDKLLTRGPRGSLAAAQLDIIDVSSDSESESESSSEPGATGGSSDDLGDTTTQDAPTQEEQDTQTQSLQSIQYPQPPQAPPPSPAQRGAFFMENDWDPMEGHWDPSFPLDPFFADDTAAMGTSNLPYGTSSVEQPAPEASTTRRTSEISAPVADMTGHQSFPALPLRPAAPLPVQHAEPPAMHGYYWNGEEYGTFDEEGYWVPAPRPWDE